MNIDGVKLVCFSPTGTGRKIIESISRGIGHSAVQMIDITKPEARKSFLELSENDLIIVIVPVYMGRVPGLIHEWLHGIKGRNTPAVPVVVYGNRTYGNALLELNDILKQSGCVPFAGGAFIGEHSFSSTETPIAEARPDSNDVGLAEEFGLKIKSKIEAAGTVENSGGITIPGSYPYGGTLDLWHIDFIAISDACRNHGICAEVCPAGAIDPQNTRIIDIEKCIICCACIKSCPEKARSIKAGKVKDAALRLTALFKEAGNSEYFI